MKKVSRNEPCPCGSGKKYKKCCLGKTTKNEDMQTCYSPEQLRVEKEAIKILDIYRGIVSFFQCSKCGECCRDGSPDLLHSDEYKNFDKDLLFWEDGLPGLKHPCPFFVNDACEIHDTNIRPRICGAAPFGFTDDPQYPIVIKSCELGEQIRKAYYVFLAETDAGENATIEDMLFPLTKIQQAKPFLNWLKKNENHMRTAKTANCARSIPGD